MKISHRQFVFLSGLIWLTIGIVLFLVGLNLSVSAILKENLLVKSHPLLDLLSPLAGGYEPAALFVFLLSLLIGYLKGQFIFKKTAFRIINRASSIPNPSAIHHFYSWHYYCLIAIMISLGIIMRYLPLDLRGAIDLIVGFALMLGSFHYFRHLCLKNLLQ
jgi:hypothetical protein